MLLTGRLDPPKSSQLITIINTVINRPVNISGNLHGTLLHAFHASHEADLSTVILNGKVWLVTLTGFKAKRSSLSGRARLFYGHPAFNIHPRRQLHEQALKHTDHTGAVQTQSRYACVQ